jgi:predicted trehalose synthase
MAQREVDRRMKEYDERNMGSGQSYAGAMAENAIQNAQDTAQGLARNASQTVSDMKNNAQEMGSTIAERAGNATTSVGEGMTSLAGRIRQTAPSEGTVGSAASTVAHQLETAGSYLQENNFDNMARDLTGLIRRYPLQSLLVGFGIGYLWARRSER